LPPVWPPLDFIQTKEIQWGALATRSKKSVFYWDYEPAAIVFSRRASRARTMGSTRSLISSIITNFSPNVRAARARRPAIFRAWIAELSTADRRRFFINAKIFKNDSLSQS
jgi:hypothetical protein